MDEPYIHSTNIYNECLLCSNQALGGKTVMEKIHVELAHSTVYHTFAQTLGERKDENKTERSKQRELCV